MTLMSILKYLKDMNIASFNLSSLFKQFNLKGENVELDATEVIILYVHYFIR